MKDNNHILDDLVSATRDGQDFYEQAANKVENKSLKSLFARIANVKGDIVQGLTSEAGVAGDVPAGSDTWTGNVNKLYSDVRSQLGGKDYGYVGKLEETESHLMKAFDKVVTDKEIPANARTVISRLIPELHSCQDLMQARKLELRKAA